MRTFTIEGKADSPDVFMDEAKKLIEIRGNSTLKETNWFYNNLLKWMIAFNMGNTNTCTVNIRLKRINDSSAKWLAVVFNKLRLFVPEKELEINWYLNSRSPRILASGLMLQTRTAYRVNMLSN